MDILICTHNSQGLLNDSDVLKEYFLFKNKNNKIIVNICNEKDILNIKIEDKYDIQIFLEHLYPNQINRCEKNYFIPNLEMLCDIDVKILKKNINNIKVLAKSISLYKILKNNIKNINIQKIIWTSINRNLDNINRVKDKFLHIKGQSHFKNTQLVLNLWLKHPEWPMLNIVHSGNENKNGYLEIPTFFNLNNNITIYQHKMEQKELNILINTCGFHICPSKTEGYGHYINEARSVGSIIIATNSDPMNTFLRNNYGIPIEIDKIDKYNYGFQTFITEQSLKFSIQKALSYSDSKSFIIFRF